jgi:two-component system sensor histidine kinase KdpD
MTDDALITHALVNLVENAARYSTPGHSIRLAGRSAGTDVEITVEDDGPGVTPLDLPHIFERFYRGKGGDGRAAGTGLGLAIVEAFVRLCGGRVRAESSQQGMRFVVTLPGGART